MDAMDWGQINVDGINPDILKIISDAPPQEQMLLYKLFGSNLGTPILILWCVCMGVATIFFMLRLGVRIFGPTGLRMDDYLLVFSYATAVTAFVLAIIQYKQYYLGRGLIAILGHANPTPMLKMLYSQIILYIVSISFSKFSFLGLYWLLLSHVDRMRKYLIASTVYIVVGSTALILWKCFACVPINLNWRVKLSSTPGQLSASEKCRIANFTALYGTYAFTIVADIIMILLSLPLLQSLKLPRREKLGIFAMFALTFLSVLAATARVVVSAITQDIVVIMGAAGVEMTLCVIIVSMPALRTLIRMKRNFCQEKALGVPPLTKPSKKNIRANQHRMENALAMDLSDPISDFLDSDSDRRGSERSISTFINGGSNRSNESSEKQSGHHVEEVGYMYQPESYQRLRQESLQSEPEELRLPLQHPPRSISFITSAIPEEVPTREERIFSRTQSMRTERSSFSEFDFELPYPYKPSPLTSPCSTLLCHSRSHSATSMC